MSVDWIQIGVSGTWIQADTAVVRCRACRSLCSERHVADPARAVDTYCASESAPLLMI